MKSKYVWLVVTQLRQIWFRVVAFAVLAIAAVVVAQMAHGVLPDSWGQHVGTESVGDILNILSTSMLAVTTFSLSIAVSAFAAAAGSATPRATALLQEDTTTQNVLSTFLGAFLFGLLGLIALKAGFYSDSGRLVLFAASLAVIALVVVALLRWISHLMTFGRIEDTLDRVEQAALKGVEAQIDRPFLGARPRTQACPDDAHVLLADETGYVQHIDMGALAACAKEMQARLWIDAMPGSFVHPSAPFLRIEGAEPDDEQMTALRAGFTCATTRTFDQDPRFGLIVMTEIASRALSPAMNDPGTAIGVLGRLVRILSHWRDDTAPDVEFDDILVPGIEAKDMLEDAFRPILRDGAALLEVQIRLQKSLAALARIAPDTFAEPARHLSAEALEYAEKSEMPSTQMKQLREVSETVR